MHTPVAPRGPVPPSADWAFFVAGDTAKCPCEHPRRPGKRCEAFLGIVLRGVARRVRPLGAGEDRKQLSGGEIRVCSRGHELLVLDMPGHQ